MKRWRTWSRRRRVVVMVLLLVLLVPLPLATYTVFSAYYESNR